MPEKTARRKEKIIEASFSLGAWACHELAQPLTAMAQGVELLAGAPEKERAEILEMVETSRRAATARMRFLQRLFVQESNSSDAALRQDLKDLARAYDVSLTLRGEKTIPPRFHQMIRAAALAALSGLQASSSLEMSASQNKRQLRLTLSARGHDAKRGMRVARVFLQSDSDKVPPPPDMPAYFAGAMARHLGGITEAEYQPSPQKRLIFSLILPLSAR